MAWPMSLNNPPWSSLGPCSKRGINMKFINLKPRFFMTEAVCFAEMS